MHGGGRGRSPVNGQAGEDNGAEDTSDVVTFAATATAEEQSGRGATIMRHRTTNWDSERFTSLGQPGRGAAVR
jgi:hypothetical protein